MPKKMMMTINPAAGRSLNANRQLILDAVEIFDKAGYRVTFFITRGRGDAETFARENAMDYDMVVCCGGDGTMSETVNGLARLESPPPLGYIPIGSTNDVASTFGIPRNPAQAAEKILAGRMLKFDIGEMKDKFFTYIAAFGAFTEASYSTPQEIKNSLGHLAYLVQGARSISQIQPIALKAEFNGKTVEGNFIFGSVSNSTSVAGLVKLDPDFVEFDDGLFEVLLIRQPANVFQLERTINGILTKNYDEKYVEFAQTSEIRFTFEAPVAWTRDGENGGEHTEITLTNRHEAIRLLIPQKEQ